MRNYKKLVIYSLLILVALVSVGPFLWLLSTALKGPGDNLFVFPPQVIPRDFTLANFVRVFEQVPFMRFFTNSVIVTAAAVTTNIVFALLAAFPLARMRFAGKRLILIGILGTIMIPFQISMIPLFVLAMELGLRNTYIGIIIPNIVTPFGIFLLRQALTGIPKSLEESAHMDGAKSYHVLFRVLMPLVKPSIAALAIFAFMMTWDDFLWPLLIIEDQSMFTLPLGVQRLQGTFTNNWRLIAAGSIMALAPVLVFFSVAQRWFIEGALAGAVKG
ncbi:MAG: carbohydrate ABC transporter permease [Spirochaetales bacterium]